MGPYSLTSPCKECPFRNDIKPYIREARVREIERSLVRSEFPCHKTPETHCAGALILMEKEGRSSQMMRIAERLGMYDRTKLNMNAPVYESFRAMVQAHRKAK